jgi:hypothetical protein
MKSPFRESLAGMFHGYSASNISSHLPLNESRRKATLLYNQPSFYPLGSHDASDYNTVAIISFLRKASPTLVTMSKTFRKYETRLDCDTCAAAQHDIPPNANSETLLSFGVWQERRLVVVPRRLEALAVNDAGTALVVLLLGDPHLLEGRQGSENGTTDPDGVLALGRSNDLDLHGRRSKSSDLLLHTVGETRVHGGTTRLGARLAIGSQPVYDKAENIP